MTPMPDAARITSRANPRVKRVLRLRTRRGRDASGQFIAEGPREVGRALESGLALRELYTCPSLASGSNTPVSADVERFEVTAPVMEKLAYKQSPESTLGVFEAPRWRLDAFEPAAGADELWLVFVGATKPGNVGAIARTALAAGAAGMLLADAVVDVFNPNAIRASTGALFRLPVIADRSDAIRDFLRRRSVRIVAADPSAGQSYTSADLTGAIAIVLGAEDRGLDPGWSDPDRNASVSIGMADGPVDSLNASVTAAILLFEAVRQRSGP